MKQTSLQRFIVQTVPRLLSQLDRDPTSPTYGSFDRNFWQYKIRDFSSAILQQSSYTLALLYRHQFPGNTYSGNSQLKSWAQAGLNYLGTIQLADGSFNEYYPNEHSYPATSFTLFAGTKAYQALNLSAPKPVETFLKAARWLKSHRETQALNQQAAAIAGIFHLHQLTKEQLLKREFAKQLNWLLRQQTSEGWFREYGGLDAGYLSTTLEFLADIYRETQNESVGQAIEKLLEPLSYLINPDGSVGGQHASRHTTYLCLGGLARISAHFPLAQATLEKVTSASVPFWQGLDDRYLTHNLFHSMIQSVMHWPLSRSSLPKLPCDRDHIANLPQAGILTYRKKNSFAVVGAKKGGVFYLWKQQQPFFAHIGWEAELGQKLITTNWLADWQSKYRAGKLTVTGYFFEPPLKKPSLRSHLLLRIASFIFGARLIVILKSMLIFSAKPTGVVFTREIIFSQKAISIIDHIKSGETLAFLTPAANFSKRHISSSNFYHPFDAFPLPKVNYKNKKSVRWQKTLPLD